MQRKFKGIGISGDFAKGILTVQKDLVPDDARTYDSAVEKAKFLENKNQLLAETDQKSKDKTFSDTQREIFAAHVVMMDDPDWEDSVNEKISEGHSALYSVYIASEEMAQLLETVDDVYIRDRAIDVRDISKQLRFKLSGEEGQTLALSGKILVLDELSASDVSTYIEAKVSAVLSHKGGATSHAAIIAKSLGLTYMSGVPTSLDEYDGSVAILDISEAQIVANPEAELLEEWETKRKAKEEQKLLLESKKLEDAYTIEGQHIEVCGNIAGLKDVSKILENGADGVALFRTEFLFLGDKLPTEEEQYDIYQKVITALGKPLTFRTLDIGGDKGSKFFPMDEENPFLGVRGLRLSIVYEEVFRTQVRAVLRAANDVGMLNKLRIMYPMVSQRSDAEWGNNVVLSEAEKLGIDIQNREFKLGIMVEVPAVAMSVDSFAGISDFISIGTNDLIQYTLASDRMNEGVRAYYNPHNPGFLRLLATAIKQARQNNIHVAVCGDLGSTPAFTSLLVSLGVQELGCVAPMIPAIKHEVRGCDTRSDELTTKVLGAHSIEEVKNALN